MKTFQLISNSEEETKEIARTVSQLFLPGKMIILDGDLGAGKTHFVKGFAAGLDSTDPVTSPTFSIANFYRTRQFDLLHIDLYRITTTDEFNDLGLTDYFDQTVVLVEWGKKFAGSFGEHLLVSFQLLDDNRRLLTFTAEGEKYTSIVANIKQLLTGGNVC